MCVAPCFRRRASGNDRCALPALDTSFHAASWLRISEHDSDLREGYHSSTSVSIDFGKSLPHCECSSHSFSTGRSGTHRPTEEPAAVRGAEDSRAGRASAVDADREVWSGREKLSHAQMELFELEPVSSEVIVQPESERRPPRCSPKRSCKHPGRQALPANLPRVERVLPCTPDQRMCKRWGKETVVIGYEESSQLDVEPAKYFVLVTKREKRACRSCEELGVVSAQLPPRIIEKCLASDRIVIDTVISKYCNHTPLHRQSVRDPDGDQNASPVPPSLCESGWRLYVE